MRRSLILIFALLSFVVNAAEHNFWVTGLVSFPDSIIYPYTVAIVNDGGVVAQQSFNKGSFKVEAGQTVKRIEISSLGMETASLGAAQFQSSDNDTINIGTIVFRPAANPLKEVTVTAQHETVRYQGMNYIIDNIKESSLADTGSMLDMLSWAPGISVGPDGKILVFGVSGSPIIYLNGTRLMDMAQIESLSSNMVKSIEVIRKPGAEYPAGTSSVIKISTSVSLSEILNVSLSERASILRRYSNRNALNIWGAHRNIVASASFTYQVNNSKQYAEAYENIFNKSGVSVRDISTDETDNIHFTRWLWFGGLTWTPTDANEFQIQYSGFTSSQRRIFENLRTTNTSDGSETICYDSRNRSTPGRHGLIGSFTHKFTNSKLNLTATYNAKSSDSDERVVDISKESQLQFNTRNANSSMLTAKTDYSWRLGIGPRQSAGIYGGRSRMSSISDYSFTGLQNSKSSVTWGEAYYSLDWDVLKSNVRAGLRGRYERQKYDVAFADTAHHNAKSHFNIVPNISIFHRFSKKFALNLYYKYDYTLPSFYELNPAVVLTDLLFYEAGNPNLKTPRSHELAIVANLPSIQLVAEYNGFKDRIMSVTSVIDNSDYFLVRPENMRGNYNLEFSANYNLAPVNSLRIYAGALVKRSHVEYVYMDELIKRNQFMTQLSANINYRPIKPLSLFLRARYTSPQLFENIRVGHSCDLSFGGNLLILNSKLNLRLEAMDLLGKSVTPSWHSYSPNLQRYRINKYDTRGVVFTATYTFTMTRNDYDELNDADDLDRM